MNKDETMMKHDGYWWIIMDNKKLYHPQKRFIKLDIGHAAFLMKHEAVPASSVASLPWNHGESIQHETVPGKGPMW